ncbi:MAG TPA: molybdopterin dinucleotide binding domain-containing protein, partial [Synergistaceae bacterium]|nr:molybdopterin dinucleotide binding domain-containing protein [Synergistaceae bacterium]
SAPGEFVKELYIEIHPTDAAELQVEPGEPLFVSSRRGTVEGRAKISDRVPPRMVFLPFHFAESGANFLTSAEVDPVSETPGYKISAVKVAKG